MANKKYFVRNGFVYRHGDALGNESIYLEGDVVELPEELGSSLHQLELTEQPAPPKTAAKASA